MKWSILLLIFFPLHSYANINTDSFKTDLKSSFEPFPNWWEEYTPDQVSFNTYRDVLKYWQSEKRCCKRHEIEDSNKRFIKTVYLEILKSNNPNILAYGSKLLNISYHDHKRMFEVQKTIFKYLKDFEQPLDFCANCKKSDLSADIVYKLLYQYQKNNQQAQGKAMAMQFLLDKKETVSDYKALSIWRSIAYLSLKENSLNEAKSIAKMVLNMYEKTAKKTSAGRRELKYFKNLLATQKNPTPPVRKLSKKRIDLKINDSFNFKLNEKEIDYWIKSTMSHISKTMGNIIMCGLIAFGLFILLLIALYFMQKTSKDSKKEVFFEDETNDKI